MLRSQLASLGLLLVLATPGRAQQPARPTAAAASTASATGRLWAATARYVLADDATLAPRRPQLLAQLDSTSEPAFRTALAQAVGGATGPERDHLKGLQKVADGIPAGQAPAVLAASIDSALVRNRKERRRQTRYLRLRQELQQLAAPTVGQVSKQLAPDSALAPTPQPAGPGYTVLTPAPGTSPWVWAGIGLALLLSASSLALAAARSRGRGRQRYHREPDGPPATDLPLTSRQQEEVQALVRRELRARRAETAAPDQRPAEPAPGPPAPPAVAAPSLPTEAPPPAPQPRPQALYANQPPVDNLFPGSALVGAPATYTIFELLVSEQAPNKASFRVLSNPGGHAGLIGSHQTMLAGACTYPSPQAGASRIVTEVPGEAQRTPGGDWQITRKAQLRFN